MPTIEVRTPKRIPADLVREKLGDTRFKKFLQDVYGDELLMPPKVSPVALQRILTVLEETGPRLALPPPGGNGHSVGHAIPLVFRTWLIENPKTRARLVTWLREKLAEQNGRGEELNGAEMREIKVAAKARVAPKRGRPKGSRNRVKVSR